MAMDRKAYMLTLRRLKMLAKADGLGPLVLAYFADRYQNPSKQATARTREAYAEDLGISARMLDESLARLCEKGLAAKERCGRRMLVSPPTELVAPRAAVEGFHRWTASERRWLLHRLLQKRERIKGKAVTVFLYIAFRFDQRAPNRLRGLFASEACAALDNEITVREWHRGVELLSECGILTACACPDGRRRYAIKWPADGCEGFLSRRDQALVEFAAMQPESDGDGIETRPWLWESKRQFKARLRREVEANTLLNDVAKERILKLHKVG